MCLSSLCLSHRMVVQAMVQVSIWVPTSVHADHYLYAKSGTRLFLLRRRRVVTCGIINGEQVRRTFTACSVGTQTDVGTTITSKANLIKSLSVLATALITMMLYGLHAQSCHTIHPYPRYPREPSPPVQRDSPRQRAAAMNSMSFPRPPPKQMTTQ